MPDLLLTFPAFGLFWNGRLKKQTLNMNIFESENLDFIEYDSANNLTSEIKHRKYYVFGFCIFSWKTKQSYQTILKKK